MRIQDKKVCEWDNRILNSVGLLWEKIKVEDSSIFNSICTATIFRFSVLTGMASKTKVYAGINKRIKQLIF